MKRTDEPGSDSDLGTAVPDDEETSPRAADAAVAADGGTPRASSDLEEVSDFETIAEEQLTQRERYRQWVEENVLAPVRIVLDDGRALLALALLAVYLLMGTVGVMVVPAPKPNQGPMLVGAFRTLSHPLGTTFLGTDIVSLIVHATPSMLKMVTAGAVFTVAVATVVGTVSGYKGGRVDGALMTVTDVAMTIPGLPLIIVLASVLELKGNPFVIGVLLSVNAWAGLARSLRSQVLTLRDEDYVEASRIMDISTSRIVVEDVLPNLMPYVTMNFVQQARNVIFASVGLYFLGILPYNSVNWGVMMNAAYQRGGAVSSPSAVHWLLMPMLAIIGLALALTLFAQSADRLFNPRVRARHAKTVSTDDQSSTNAN